MSAAQFTELRVVKRRSNIEINGTASLQTDFANSEQLAL